MGSPQQAAVRRRHGSRPGDRPKTTGCLRTHNNSASEPLHLGKGQRTAMHMHAADFGAAA